ncbi:hypothetical protein PsorP6_009565 [Peronosclerospora sorghi]|uniref:Uncharacterized protein n=1 Tax=Peronosclerospora sorghi TaxID=230839 RepID=A0ACC0VZP5_9STRA|nr:hypothetical protein PsorP6_009565 [Peronosclerospora sorghi]
MVRIHDTTQDDNSVIRAEASMGVSCGRLPQRASLLLMLLVTIPRVSAALGNHSELITEKLTPSTATTTTTTDVTTDYAAEDEDNSTALIQKQLLTLRVCAALALVMYVPLSLVVAWRTSLHFLYSSRSAKKVFHVTLLLSTLLQLPEAIEWVWNPLSQSWQMMYILRVYSLLLLSLCKSYLAICWAGVVSAGQRTEQQRISKVVVVLNSLMALWGVLVPIMLLKYNDNVYGQYSFMNSALRGVLTYSGVIVVVAYGFLLGYQGFRLRRRLLLARGTVPTSSVEKSHNQLMLAIFIFIASDVVRLLALVLNESGTAMSIVVYLILYNIIPSVFPTVCMLYLMRRITDKCTSDIKGLGVKCKLSKYIVEPNEDEGSRRNAESDPQAQNQYICHQQDPIQSVREAQASPAFCWVRESTEIR